MSAPSVFTIPPHRAFANALAAGLIALHGDRPEGLAGGIILLPNNRAIRAVTDAFVRRSDKGLLLPRMVPVGDPEMDERIGGALDPIGDGSQEIPPAIEPIERMLLLAQLVQRHGGGEQVDAGEALRLAQDLARTLDQLQAEQIDPRRLKDLTTTIPDLSQHWQASLDHLEVILTEWPKLLAERGLIDLAERRNRLLAAMATRWRTAPPPGFVVAAGIGSAAPAIGALLHRVARLERGMVIFSGLDLGLDQQAWDALGPHAPDPVTGVRRRPMETHPQYELKRLLDLMDVGRGEVRGWRWGGGRDAPAARSRAIANAMLPAALTKRWQGLKPPERRLGGVRGLELASPAEEAQAIALALRETLETPEHMAALVTPDRALARRVAAHLRRWGIEADDSAGRPLSEMPAGTLLLALAEAGAEAFAPVPLLTLLKHPLVMRGERRAAWLEGVRKLDLALRGPRPAAGLAGIDAHLADQTGRDKRLRAEAATWWQSARTLLVPLEQAFRSAGSLPPLLEALRIAATDLTGAQAWAGQAGRQAADLFASLEEHAGSSPRLIQPDAITPFLELLLRGETVRPPFGQHPRIFIWGLIEARLQHADLLILGGLNEGTWPALPAPDPWLAPRIRAELGMPGLERRVGISAHDFATSLGARQVLVTRARRDARSPAVASRFWLRLEAMTGGLTRAPLHRSWVAAIDRPRHLSPAGRPKPAPPADRRPRAISVTEVDRLKADPYAFYARRMLRLSALDPLDADPSAAWRGSAVHKVLEEWFEQDRCDPERLRPRAEAFLAGAQAHPLMRALWQPRLLEAIDWIAAEVAKGIETGRRPFRSEAEGNIELAGIALKGIADRIDRAADGSLVIVDYKTGKPPTGKAVAGGFAMQLGLLGLIAERGGFASVDGVPTGFEYWSFGRGKNGDLGHVASPVGGKNPIEADDFTRAAEQNFVAAAARWLTGEEPFVAKLHPQYAPYGEYDQLMRLDEWYGRE